MKWVETFKQMKAGLILEKSVREEVDQTLVKYPFFAMARMVAAKVATKEGDPRAQGLRFLASLYAPHRQYYAFFMGDRVRPNVAPPPRTAKHESQPPRQTSSQEEPPASSDEPGPASPMPVSHEYIPRLQGKLRAKTHLYKGLSERIRQAIRLPPIPPPTPLQQVPPPPEAPRLTSVSEVAASGTTPLEPVSPMPLPPQGVAPVSEVPVVPPLPQAPSLEIVSPEPPPSDPTASEKSDEPLSPADLPHISVGSSALELPPAYTQPPLPSSPAKLSPLLLTLQFELSDKPPAPKSPLESISPVHDLVTSESLSPDISTSPTPETESASPIPMAEPPPLTSPLPEPLSAFSKPYVPLDNPEAPLSLASSPLSEKQADTPEGPSTPSTAPSQISTPHPTQVAESTSTPSLSEPISAFSKAYLPLENPEAPVTFSQSGHSPAQTASDPLSQDIYRSESPIRLILQPDFHPEGSIHLPVPDPTQEDILTQNLQESLPISATAPIPPSSSMAREETTSPTGRPLSPTWQSFLSEIEKPLIQAAQEALQQTPQAVEKLRQTFIRYLLEARKERRPPQEPPPASTAIEEVLRLLETFQLRAPESMPAPTLMSIPESDPLLPPPTIYTETMARLCWSQGDLPLAIEIYKKLAAKYPEKATYYETQISRIQRGESP